MDFLRLHGIGLGTIAFGQSRIDVPPLDDYHLAVFCINGQARLKVGAEEIDVDHLNGVLCPANQPLSGQFSPDCEQFVVRVDKIRLETFGGRRGACLMTRMDLRSPRLLPWMSTLNALATEPSIVRLVQDDPCVAADYEQLLLRLLLTGQEKRESHPGPGPVRPASVRRATGFIEANMTTPITLADMAAASGVPERTLHDAFRRFEGLSPMRYLRNLRLDRIHTQLCAGGPDTNVTAIALGCGFSHLGRFAQAYAERFGQRPSQTLRRR